MAESRWSIERASGEELLARGIATLHGSGAVPGRLVEIGVDAGLVYVIQSVIRASPVKVGYSNASSLPDRLASLQTGNPERLAVLAVAVGYPSQERRAHKALANDQMTGEWFGWSPRVASFVKALREGGVEAAIGAAKAARDRPA